MPLTDKNQLLIAYKRLLGKTHTNPSFGISNETIGAYIQAASSQIFGEDHSLNKVLATFTVHSLDSGVYSANLETGQYEDNSPIAHVFELKLKDGLDSLGFSAGTAVKDEIKLQLLSDSLNSIYYPKLFKIVDGQKQEIAKYSAINWLIDYASGILFVQDSSQEQDRPPNAQWEVEAYVYTGKYLDQKVQEAAQSGGIIGSPSDDLLIVDSDAPGDTDIIPGTVAIIFEDPIGSEPPPDYKAAIAYHEGELDFYTQNLNSNNIVMNLSGSVLSASNINAYGPNGSLQFHNSQGLLSGSSELVWDNDASTLTTDNINSISAIINTINANTINANTISTDTIAINDGGAGIPAAGASNEIQYNSNGYLGATDKFFISQDANIFSSVVKNLDNSVSLFVNSSGISNEQTSGILLSNSSVAGAKELLVNRQYDDTTQIYKINSDLPLYINSDIQNKITAGSSKIDMSAGKVEIWPNTTKYLKVDADSISSNITDILVSSGTDDVNLYVFDLSAGPIWNERNDPTIKFNNTDQEVEFLTNVGFFRTRTPSLFVNNIYGKTSWPVLGESLEPGSEDLIDLDIKAKKVSIQESLELMDNYINIKTNKILKNDKVFEQIYYEEFGTKAIIFETSLKPKYGSGLSYFFDVNLISTTVFLTDSSNNPIVSAIKIDMEFFDSSSNTIYSGNEISNIVEFINTRLASTGNYQEPTAEDVPKYIITDNGKNHSIYTGAFKFKDSLDINELKMRITARLYFPAYQQGSNSTIEYLTEEKTKIIFEKGSSLRVSAADLYE